MTVIRVSEQSIGPDGSFETGVAFDESAEYIVRVSDPADPGTEALLAWYFEEHLQFPFLDADRKDQAVERLARYGRDLFTQVFGGPTHHDYRRLRERAFDGCRLEVAGSAPFHLLHWEALRDPDMDAPLAVRLPVTRRVVRLGSRFALPPERPTLNILVVTARPFGPGDVGYRTISRPLLDAMRQSSLPVVIDLVRPGTWEALRAHLRAQTQQRRSGWYQVVHFDLHGGFSDFAALDQQRAAGRLTFGAAPVAPFDGKRPFLFFETAVAGRAAPVPAAEVASLLGEHRIPVAVLNACQSAMQSGNEASLAQHLVEVGVPVAIGMAYSVTVSAAALAMPVLYAQLSQGADPVAAMHAARRALYETTSRQAYFGQQINLQDWVLPVAFRQQPVSIRLRAMDDEEQTGFYQRQAAVGDEPPTEFGFVGRDLDIQAIERQLLTTPQANEILIQGMAGAGKSTLLRHLAWWWQCTGLIDELFTFSYEDRAWTCRQIVWEMQARLLTGTDQARAETMPESAQLEQIARLLRARRHLVIVDNAESITATPAAIPHALGPGEQAQIKTLLSRLRGGKTLVLIGSREAESWLASDSFRDNTYPLPGLDPQAASALADRILRRHDATRWLADTAERSALEELVDLLGGYPLPMTVVLPTLATTAPRQVLDDLRTGESSPDPTSQITRAIEYSHGKLDPALQASLLLLAPFTAVIHSGPTLAQYQSLLLQDSAAQAAGPIDLAGAVAEAVKVGLAAPHPLLPTTVQVQPVLPYFLRSRLRQEDHLQAVAIQAHYELYRMFSQVLHQLLTAPDNPQDRAVGQAATRADYANLITALEHGLATGQPITALVRPLEEYLDQAKQHTTLRSLLDDTITRYPQPATSQQKQELADLHNLAGSTAFRQHRLTDAKAHHETELQLLQALGNRKGQAAPHHQLGLIALQQRQYAEAEAACRRTLDITLEFGDPQSALIYLQLGMIAEEQRRYAEAEDACRKVLDITQKSGDRRVAAAAYHQLGRVAQAQQQFDQAKAAYHNALSIFREFRDRHSAALTYHQLSQLAISQQQFEEADTLCRQALNIFLEFRDRHSEAKSYAQLAMIAQAQQRFEEAKAACRKALDIYLECGDQHATVGAYIQLATIAQAQQQLGEAEAAFREALSIVQELGDQHEQATLHDQLAMIAQTQQRFEEAEAGYRKAISIYQKTDQRRASEVSTSLGRLLASRGRHAEAAGILLNAAITWCQLTGSWDAGDLQPLKQIRQQVGDTVFIQLITANVPQDLQEELITAIDNVSEP